MSAPAPFHAELAEAPAGADPFWVATEDGKRIRAVAWNRGGRGTAILFTGRSEYCEKYGRVVGRLIGLGLSVVVFDWRGQGLSTRDPQHPTTGHVEDFRDYQRDVAAVLAEARVAALPAPWIMVGHSMGGCIGLRTLLEGTEFRGAVFSAPMWHLQMRAATRQITDSIAQLATLLGLGHRRMPGTNARPSALALAFEGNVLTSDREHFEWFGRQLTARPELGLGGPSVQWTYAALEEMARLYVAPVPKLPVLTFLGTEEAVVSPSVIRAQMAAMPNGTLVICEGGQHELFMERPAIQDVLWGHVATFVDRVAGPGLPELAPAAGRRNA